MNYEMRLSVQHLAFNPSLALQHSAFSIQHSAFNIQHSPVQSDDRTGFFIGRDFC